MNGQFYFLDMNHASQVEVNAIHQMLFMRYDIGQHQQLFQLTHGLCTTANNLDATEELCEAQCKDASTILVFVKTITGTTVTLNVSPLQSISSLKDTLNFMYTMPVGEQRLSYGATELEDNLLVTDYHISENSMLQLNLRVRGGGGFQLFGKCLGNPFELNVDYSDEMSTFWNKNRNEGQVLVWLNVSGALEQAIILPDEDGTALDAPAYDTTYSSNSAWEPVFSSKVTKYTGLSRRNPRKQYKSQPYIHERSDSSDYETLPTKRKLESTEKKDKRSTNSTAIEKLQAINFEDANCQPRKEDDKPKKCPKCDFSTNKKSTLDTHIKSHEKQQRIKCPEPRCDYNFHTIDRLEHYLEIHHKRKMEIENKEFKSIDEFDQFLEELKLTEFADYVARRKGVYYCHRSGSYESKANWKNSSTGRFEKSAGSIKLGHTCPSRIYLDYSKNDSTIKMRYHKTHVGHTLTPGRVGLSKGQKVSVAAKLQLGVPKQTILQEIRNSFKSKYDRLGLSTMQDIDNIGTKFGYGSNVRLHPDDAVSIDAMVELLNAEGENILVYKPQGVTDPRYPTLKTEDFLLGFMNNGQEEMLKLYGHNIICIDSTHGTNAYNFEMTTLVVIDDRSQGFPVAIFFHSSKTQDTYQVFFEQIKKRLDVAVIPNVFMSDDEQAFYNAWKTVMGKPMHKLLCSWHVLKNWWRNLKSVKLESKDKKDIYDQLQFILKELDELTFKTAFQNILAKLDLKTETQEFGKYLQSYGKRTEEWAYCYRRGAGINTNMHLENMHRDIKYNYLGGKKIKRLDAGFAAVTKFIHDKQVRRIIADERRIPGTKVRKANKYHKRAYYTKQELLYEDTSKTYWEMKSLSNPDSHRTYKITRNPFGCPYKDRCPEMCSACKICKHVIQCTCHEYSIKNNMCKHVHMVGMYFPETKTQTNDADTSDEELNFIIDTNVHVEQSNQEIRAHMQDLAKPETSTKEVDLTKGDDYYNAIRLLVKCEKGQKHFEDVLRTLKASLTSINEATTVTTPMAIAALKEPLNKKIVPQRGFQSTRKIIKVKKTPKQPDSTQLASQLGILRFLPATDD